MPPTNHSFEADGQSEPISEPRVRLSTPPSSPSLHTFDVKVDVVGIDHGKLNGQHKTEDVGSPMAIVGIGLRMPGGCRDKREFLDLLSSQNSGITVVPEDRWNRETYTGPADAPAKIITDKAGFLDSEHVSMFDAAEYGIAPIEATSLDPHQTILLDVARDALEDAGVCYRGSQTGVFVSGSSDYQNVQWDLYQSDSYCATGTSLALQPNRISYVFDLKGPSCFFDTACSSTMMALHYAIQSINAGDCDQALVGGVSILLTQRASISFTKLGTLSPTGTCHAFDADADGYVRSEGCSIIIIKPLKQALADGDHVYAAISGTAVNANGRGRSVTMPGTEGQMNVIRTAYQRAGRSPSDAVYFECHGTGTGVGDPIEANAIGAVVCESRNDTTSVNPVRIGSVKTHIGHLEWAAAMAGLLKASLILDTETLLPTINFKTPNPKIEWDAYNLTVATKLEPIPLQLTADNHRIVSVSSFGFGGANGHAVLERLVRRIEHESKEFNVSENGTPLLWFAGSFTARSTTTFVDALKDKFSGDHGLPDPFTLSVLSKMVTSRGRAHPYSSFTVGHAPSAALSFSAPSAVPMEVPNVVLVFSGQGPQYPEMGKRLFARFQSFRDSIVRSDSYYQEATGKSFIATFGLFDPSIACKLPSAMGDAQRWPTSAVVLALVMFHIATFDLWTAIGLKNAKSILGHSVGEIAAMYACGSISQRVAIRLAIARAEALGDLTPGAGMCALGCGRDVAEDIIQRALLLADDEKANGVARDQKPRGLWISAINSPSAVSVSGNNDLLEELVKVAKADKVFARILNVGGAFHSPMVESSKTAFIAAATKAMTLDGTSKTVPKTLFVSTVDGTAHLPNTPLTPMYCWRNLREPVQFVGAVKAALNCLKDEDDAAASVMLEISPHPVLAGYVEEIIRSHKMSKSPAVVSSAKRPNQKKGESDRFIEDAQFLTAAGELMQAGYRSLNVSILTGLHNVDIALGETEEAYKWFPKNWRNGQKRRDIYMNEYVSIRHERLAPPQNSLGSPFFRLSATSHPWVTGHIINDAILFPAAGYIDAAFQNGARTVRNVNFRRALVIEPDKEPRFYGFVAGNFEGAWSFRSSSMSTIDVRGPSLDVLHADGYMTPEVSALLPDEIQFATNLDEYLTSFDEATGGNVFYENVKKHGLLYDGEFKLVDHVRYSSTSSDLVFGLLDIPENIWDKPGCRGMVVHPGILDCALQVSSLVTLHLRHSHDTWVPGGCDRVSLHASPAEIRDVRKLGVIVRNKWFDGNTYFNDVVIVDMLSRKVVIVIRGLTGKRLHPRSQLSKEKAFTLVWEPLFVDAEVVVPDIQVDEEADDEMVAAILEEAIVEITKTGDGDSVRKILLDTANGVIDRLYTSTRFASAAKNTLVETVKSLIISLRDTANRRVVRILELQSGPKSLRRELNVIAESLSTEDFTIEVARVNITDERDDPLRSILSSCKCRLISFDAVVGWDLVETLVSLPLLEAGREILVPGGLFLFSSPSGTNSSEAAKVLSAAFGFGCNDGFKLPTSETLNIQCSGMSEAKGFPVSRHLIVEMRRGPLGALTTDIVDTTSVVTHNFVNGNEMELIEAVKALSSPSTARVWVSSDNTPEGVMGVALALTLRNEIDGINANAVVFDTGVDSADRKTIIDLLLSINARGPTENAFRVDSNGRLYSRKLVVEAVKSEQSSASPHQSTSDWVLDFVDRESLSIDSLRPHTLVLPALGSHDVEVQSMSVALNFKNVLSALGLLAQEDRLCEFAGVVKRIGDKVTRFKIGDKIMGSTNNSREASTVVANEFACALLPQSMSYADGSAFTVVYGTAWHSLVDIGRIQAGDVVLIHSAAGGVGLAAIQIAQRFGCKVFCTVSNETKRKILHEWFGISYDCMANSRSHEIWTVEASAWLEQNGYEGFDVVLSSLQGPSLQAGCKLLAPLGKFVDISKRDILASAPMNMNMFATATSYNAVELGITGRTKPRRLAQILDDVAASHINSPFTHLVGHLLHGVHGVIDAYKLMQSGEHIGKIVIDLETESTIYTFPSVRPANNLFDPRKSYVLVGGCGGLGPRITLWMAQNGAKHIFLTGRRGLLDPAGDLLVRAARHVGGSDFHIDILAADASDEAVMRSVFELAATPVPIGGIMLMTVVLADELFVNMTEEKFTTVMRSKVDAFRVIQSIVDLKQIEFFLLFSSSSVLFSNPGQANYSAAQSLFDRIAQDLPNTVSVAVPAITDIGVFAELVNSEAAGASIKALKALAITSEELCDVVGTAIHRVRSGSRVPYFIPALPWSIADALAPSLRANMSHLIKEDADDAEIAQGTTAVDPVSAIVSKLLKVDPVQLEDNVTLSSLGLDSLLASRLSVILDAEFGIHVTQMQLLGGVTVAALQGLVTNKSTSTSEQAQSDPDAIASALSANPQLLESIMYDYAEDIDKLDEWNFSATGVAPVDLTRLTPDHEITILLTGATGFVGSCALVKLLERFPKAKVICLVRAPTSTAALERIKSSAIKHQTSAEADMSRIVAVPGNIALLRLGLTRDEWRGLAASVDIIIHCGACVDWSIPYTDLRGPNVVSVAEVLRLATTTKLKPVKYLSSAAIFFDVGAPDVVLESFDISELHGKHMYGYQQSKYVGEQLCKRAKSRGVPVSIVRTGLVTGNSETGVTNVDDFLSRLILSGFHMGIHIELPGEAELTPVDHLSDIMARLASTPASWENTTYHVTSGQNVKWSELINLGTKVSIDTMRSKVREMLLEGTDGPLIPFAEVSLEYVLFSIIQLELSSTIAIPS
ncbi:polyketide synthase [Cladochytrium replicatum]|nr:polyketide synthase [Cladochytrium replicatum]